VVWLVSSQCYFFRCKSKKLFSAHVIYWVTHSLKHRTKNKISQEKNVNVSKWFIILCWNLKSNWKQKVK
jgi:hypothetical protein